MWEGGVLTNLKISELYQKKYAHMPEANSVSKKSDKLHLTNVLCK
jgi:hypothetical protein